MSKNTHNPIVQPKYPPQSGYPKQFWKVVGRIILIILIASVVICFILHK